MKAKEFKDIRLKLGLTQEELGNKLGITKRQIINYEKGESKINSESADMIRTLIDEINYTNPPNTPPMKQIEAEVIIPYYKDFSVSAGFGSLNFDGEIEMLPFNKNELRAMFGISNFNKMGIISVIGDSMHPTLKEGQMLLFQEDGSSIEGAIYIIEYQSELFVKRLKKRPLSLVSDNKEYSNIEIKELQELKIIGRVVGAYEIVYQRL